MKRSLLILIAIGALLIIIFYQKPESSSEAVRQQPDIRSASPNNSDERIQQTIQDKIPAI